MSPGLSAVEQRGGRMGRMEDAEIKPLRRADPPPGGRGQPSHFFFFYPPYPPEREKVIVK
jgi:hypothetical protein